jgi:hypothetical protein
MASVRSPSVRGA